MNPTPATVDRHTVCALHDLQKSPVLPMVERWHKAAIDPQTTPVAAPGDIGN